MTTFSLRDDGFSYKKIYNSGRWVGRVCQHAEGGFLGIIKPHSVRMPTERQAFDEVVAKALGFQSAAELHAHNSVVREHNRQARANARHAAREFFAGNDKPFFDILSKW